MANRYSISDAAGKRILSKLNTLDGFTRYDMVLPLLAEENIVGYDSVGKLIEWCHTNEHFYMASAIGRAAANEARELRDALKALTGAQEVLKDLANQRWPA